MIKVLSQLQYTEKGVIVKIRGRGNVHRMLLEIGLTIGTIICLSDANSLDNCIEVHADNGRRLVYRSIANNIYVEIG